MRDKIKQLQELLTTYQWVDELQSIGYNKEKIMNMMIDVEKRNGNLIGIINILEVKDK
ncbi:hypothetical protein [Sphingobacterium mizutaii]|uniref:hypothetical protein n=1 Tax=Sphingobacterium mizutaii TaxID=1010 RepID=UPI0016249FAB|nr:hypothetical protein [Sphingobacterium mizutaii]